jgi:thiol-disulfide isomerase/thioredoxin
MMKVRRTALLAVAALVTSPALVLAPGIGSATAGSGASGSDHAPRSVAAPTAAPKADPDPRPNSAPLSTTRTKAAAVTLTVQAPSPTTYGDSVHLVATVDLSKLAGGGMMSFTDNGVVIGFGGIDGTGTAEMFTSTLSAVKHSLVASYTVSGKTTSATAALTVNKRDLHLFAQPSSWSRPVGAANPTLTTAVVPGNEGDLVNGDTLATAVSGKPKFSVSAGPTSPASLYPVSLSGLKSTNYALVYLKWNLVVYTGDIAEGSTAPELTGPDQYGNDFSLSSLRGKAVLLDFSAVWCGPSNQLAHDIPKIAGDLQSQGISFTYLPVLIDGPSVDVPSTQTNAANYFTKYKLPGQTHVLHMDGTGAAAGSPLPALLDAMYGYGAVPTDMQGGLAYPTLAFIDADGTIQDVSVGYPGIESVEAGLAAIAPDTGVQVTSAPSAVSGSRDATIEFTTTGDVQAQCSIDGAAFADCDSPLQLTELADGPHSVEITIGLPYTALVSWTVIPIDTTITSGPGDTYVPTFEFTGSGNYTGFECWSDDETPYPCESPSGVYQMPGGLHTFHVAAVGANGLRDETPATMEFTTQPLPTMTLVPDNPNPGPTDHVTWTATFTDATTGDPVTGTVTFGNDMTGLGPTIALAPDGTASYTETFAGGGYTEYAVYNGDAAHGAGFTGAWVP